MQMTLTLSNGEKTRKYLLEFRQPCLNAPLWIMASQLNIFVLQTDEIGPIPIIAYECGIKGGVTVNVSEGVWFEGKCLKDVKHVVITIRPIASQEVQFYLLSAIYHDGQNESLVLFEENFRANQRKELAETGKCLDNISFTERLEAAVEQVEAMGKWWLPETEYF